ncbi:MerR family DNA-binding protein [Sphaerimonospora mesophila]|uniref:MerR family DNA-binding protein n=1 Tax=Sphaerimonospora mesophila TaxID=37483 RepID=UPI000B25B6E4
MNPYGFVIGPACAGDAAAVSAPSRSDHAAAPRRSDSGQRHYPESAADRVHLIQMLYAAGLSSRTIAELLPYVEAKVSTPASRARLAAERDRIDARIAALTRTRDRLDTVIQISGSPGSGCTWVEEHDVAAEAGRSATP